MRTLALALVLLFTLRVGAASDADAGRKQLNDLIAEYWEYNLKQNPVFASIIGDKRFNDQLGSYSEKAILEDQARKKAFLRRFEAIDTTGFPRQDKLNRELEVDDLRNDIEETDLKLWEMPVSQVSGLHIEAPQLVSVLSFETVKDYEDYIARLGQMPRLSFALGRLGLDELHLACLLIPADSIAAGQQPFPCSRIGRDTTKLT